ncbi:hypothetical protein MyNCGM683_21570 [Achromobacter xylosoxidans]
MKSAPGLNFVQAWWRPTGLAAVMMAAVVAMGTIVVGSGLNLGEVQAEMENIEHRIDQRKRANEANQLRQRRLSPEDRRIERALQEQDVDTSGSGLAVIDWIEGAWTPEIAVRQIIVDKAGRQARIEGGAATLTQVYQFADRLHGYRADRKIGLLQHHTAMEQGRQIIRFTLTIEKP